MVDCNRSKCMPRTSHTKFSRLEEVGWGGWQSKIAVVLTHPSIPTKCAVRSARRRWGERFYCKKLDAFIAFTQKPAIWRVWHVWVCWCAWQAISYTRYGKRSGSEQCACVLLVYPRYKIHIGKHNSNINVLCYAAQQSKTERQTKCVCVCPCLCVSKLCKDMRTTECSVSFLMEQGNPLYSECPTGYGRKRCVETIFRILSDSQRCSRSASAYSRVCRRTTFEWTKNFNRSFR